MLQEQIIDEIKHIPADKLAEVYDLIHYFRLGLLHEKINATPIKKEKIGFSERWQGQFKPNDEVNSEPCLDYLKDRYQL